MQGQYRTEAVDGDVGRDADAHRRGQRRGQRRWDGSEQSERHTGDTMWPAFDVGQRVPDSSGRGRNDYLVADPIGGHRPGVFAAGDVRSGSAKRVAAAVGEGSMVVQFAHEVLETL
jgi:thioredoxin reductase